MNSGLKFIQFDAEFGTRNSWPPNLGDIQDIASDECTVPNKLDQIGAANTAVVPGSDCLQISTDTIDEIRQQYRDESRKNNRFMTNIVEDILTTFVPQLIDKTLTLSVIAHTRFILSRYQERKLTIHVPRNRLKTISAMYIDSDDDVVVVCDEQLTDNSATVNFDGCRMQIDFDEYFDRYAEQVTIFLEKQKVSGPNELK